MIVRILSEGQYRLSGSFLDQLNELDNQLVELVSRGEEKAFQKVFGQMLELVRTQGTPLAPEELVESDIVLPAPDITLEEAKALFKGEGLIPG